MELDMWCDCYKTYQNDNFFKYFSDNRSSYFACKSNESAHRVFPIMIGSFLDRAITGSKTTYSTFAEKYLGCFIITGNIKILPNFLTNNTIDVHVYRQKNYKNMAWYRFNHQLKYGQDGVVNCNYPDGWMAFLQQCIHEDFVDGAVQTTNDENQHDLLTLLSTDPDLYVGLFTDIRDNYPNIDMLSNKIVISGAEILYRKRFELQNWVNASNMFENGNFYMTVSRKVSLINGIVKYKDPNSYKKRDNDMYLTIDSSRLKDTFKILAYVRRSVNDQIQNSKALEYPIDGKYFVCPLTIREMKDAGEVIYFTNNVVMSRKCNNTDILRFLNENLPRSNNQCGGYKLVLNGILTVFEVNLNNDHDRLVLLQLKRQFSSLNYIKLANHILIKNTDNMLLKWSERYQVFFSSFEIYSNFFKLSNPFETYDKYSYFTLPLLNLRYFYNALPSKTTVSINNIRGSIAYFKDLEEMDVFKRLIGHGTALVVDNYPLDQNYTTMTNKNIKQINEIDLLQYAILPDTTLPTPNQQNILEKIRLFRLNLHKQQPISTFHSLLPANHRIRDILSSMGLGDGYDDEIMDIINKKINYDTKHSNTFLLYTAFADIMGGTVEDGIVADCDFVAHAPKILINTALTIRVDPVVQSKSFIKSINFIKSIQYNNGRLLFGTIESNIALKMRCSNNVIVDKIEVSNLFLYSISIKINYDGTDLYGNAVFNSTTNTLNIEYRFYKSIGIGTKLCNKSGQKALISKIADLSTFTGKDRHGKTVKPQILYSPVSILGRLATRQVLEMFTRFDEVFVTENGGVIGIQEFYMHNIDPITRLKKSYNKLECMTQQNGFDANNLSLSAHLLKQLNNENNNIAPYIYNILQSSNNKIEMDN